MKKLEPMWRRYVRFFGPNVEADVDDELADHLSRLEAALRAKDTAEEEIAVAVRARFGDADAIRARLRRTGATRLKRNLRVEAFGNLGQDVKFALRRLRQRPGFTAAVVVVLALGVGATTAMFSAVDAAMLRPLPFAHPEQLVELNSLSMPFAGGPANPPPKFEYPNVDDIARMTGTFSHVAVFASGSLNLADASSPMRVRVGVVTPAFFGTLGILPTAGRGFTDAEGTPGSSSVVVLSDDLWRRHFGSRPMVDSVVSLSGTLRTVVGIMPRGFSFPNESDLWIPMTNPTTMETFTPFRSFLPTHTLARLADGIDPRTADLRVRLLWTRTASEAAAVDSRATGMFHEMIQSLREKGFSERLQPSLVGDRSTALLMLLGATGVLLLIACANITSLLLSQAAVRRPEMAVRAILGATRTRLVRQLLTESILLAASGTALGILMARPALRSLSALMPLRLAGIAPPELDWRVLGFAAGVALLTGVGFGLWPAWGGSGADLASGARSGGRHATPGTAARGRRVLLIVEIALAVLLLVGAGLSLRSFTRLIGVDRGLESTHVATLEFNFGADAATASARVSRIQAMIDWLEASPLVEAAGVVNVLPLGGDGGISISVHPEGTPLPPPDQQREAYYLIASGGYFRAMGIPLLSGRVFTVADDSGAPKVAVINREMAESFWPGESPIGRRFVFVRKIVITVVGVVGDVRITGLDTKPTNQMYFPIEQQSTNYLALVARGMLPPSALLARVRDAVHAVDPSQAVYRVRMMDDVVSASVAPQRTNTLLISMFGGLGLMLTALGVYAVVSYTVVQRRRELGIRSALGASSRDIVVLVSRELLWVTAIGVALGLAVAWAAARVMSSLVFGVTTHDPLTFLLAPLALIIPAAAATLIPARRAACLNPLDVIREE